MEILLPENSKFDINQPSSKLIDSKMCVLDYADKDNVDFYMKKITSFISYRYPSVDLLIGNKYHLELPLNWRVMICNEYEQICELVPIEELLHFPNQSVIFNPFYSGLPKFVDIKINKINPNPIEHFVPKLPKKNCLVIPLGNKEDWEIGIVDKETNNKLYYPYCLLACDDIDSSKMELSLYGDIIV